jgi:hypothetical protein
VKAPKRIVAGISSTALVLGAGAGIATASQKSAHVAGVNSARGGPPGAAAIATYLGLTSDQIMADLKNGQTLAQIATAQGKAVTGLEDAIVADAKTHLDAAVAAGNLTATQESDMLAQLQSHVADIVNATGPPAGGKGGPGGPSGPATQAIAAYLGLTAAQIKADLRSGQTLAQIAVAQGLTAAGLEDAIVADAKTHLDAAVAAGKLTSAQETTMLADIQSHVADMVNSTGPPAGAKPSGNGRPGSAAFTRRLAGVRR